MGKIPAKYEEEKLTVEETLEDILAFSKYKVTEVASSQFFKAQQAYIMVNLEKTNQILTSLQKNELSIINLVDLKDLEVVKHDLGPLRSGLYDNDFCYLGISNNLVEFDSNYRTICRTVKTKG